MHFSFVLVFVLIVSRAKVATDHVVFEDLVRDLNEVLAETEVVDLDAFLVLK